MAWSDAAREAAAEVRRQHRYARAFGKKHWHFTIAVNAKRYFSGKVYGNGIAYRRGKDDARLIMQPKHNDRYKRVR